MSRNRAISFSISLLLLASFGLSTFLTQPIQAQAGSRVCFRLDSNWGTGFQGTMTITNTGTTTIQNWQLEFDFPHTITSIWDSRIISRTGNHYVIGAASWNPNIAAGASLNFGFNGSLSGTFVSPANFRLNGVAVSCNGTTPPQDTQAPTAPGNLRSTGTTSTTVALAWNASTDNVAVTSYEVFRGTTSAGTTTGTSLTVTGLTPSTTFSFTVRARDAAGNVSAASNTLTVTTPAAPADTQAPTAPGNLRVTAVTSSSVSLAWNASTDNVGVTGYNIFRGTTAAGTTTATSFTVTGLTPSTTFSFTVRARDAAGNQSAASNSVSATTTGAGGGSADRIIVGYWHNFDNGSGFIKLRNVSDAFDVINVAFAEASPGSTSLIRFVPDAVNTSVNEVKSDIAILKSRGKKVLISIGGANSHVQLNTTTDRQNFINSMIGIISEYGFDGMDIDLEGSSVSLNGGDLDFRTPTTPRIVNLISAIRTIADMFGPNFVLSMAPETFFVQVGFEVYGGSAGAYLPVIHALRDKLTFIHVQHYNTGSVRALDGVAYSSANADFHVAMAEMLLQGFPVAGNTSRVFSPLRADQVAIGLPAAPPAAGSGFTPPAEVQRALDYLIRGIPFGGRYTLRNPAGYPGFRGLMTWSINWDAFNGFQFSNSHRAYLDSLP